MSDIEYEYAVFYKVREGVHRGPMSREDAYTWVRDAVIDGFKPGTFFVKRRPVNDWEDDK